MKRYKFQALVTPYAADEGDARAKLSSGSHRMVLRAEHGETRRSQVFSYLQIGSHFSLWLGGDVGQGVVTRRLLI
jgi:hypothetical protein